MRSSFRHVAIPLCSESFKLGHVESNQLGAKDKPVILGADRNRTSRSVPFKSLLALLPKENLTNEQKTNYEKSHV
jgi:hypothetical protein